MTALRLSIDALPRAPRRARIQEDLDELEADGRPRRRPRLAAPSGRVWRPLRTRSRSWRERSRLLACRSPRTRDAPSRPSWHSHPFSSGRAWSDLAALVDILLDNVFSYTDDGAEIRVSLTMSPDEPAATLVVEDAGAGWPSDLNVADRGVSTSGSSGLGLSIANSTAEASGGRLELGSSAMGGTRVRVVLGTAP